MVCTCIFNGALYNVCLIKLSTKTHSGGGAARQDAIGSTLAHGGANSLQPAPPTYARKLPSSV